MALSGIEYSDPNRLGLQWLPRVGVSSVTKLHHTASHTLLTQTFINPSTVSPIPSAQYTFPLYESCAIVAFRCHVGSRLIEGIIQEKDDASATFQAAIDRNEPASLLEQHSPDVFSTSIGNIPTGETVKVEIEYITELKHDAEVDGLRFTIPTSIAPRYGAQPTGLSKRGASGAVTAENMNISVQVNMPGSIQSVESPSHTISLQFGGHSTNDTEDASNSHHALVTLTQTTTELGRDFILLIKCTSLSSPAALLEAHPTIPDSNALMVTLIPRFNLPISTRPEVVFIVDRSGSMSSRMPALKSSLSVFLKSLPVEVNFNICSFGSHHSFLWDRSRPYSNPTFLEAQEHCNRMQATFGGTEILPAIKSTIQRRQIGMNLEIMLLTDGEVWESEVLFKYVEKETKKGDVRLFSLGIGRDVSHALIDGLARVGRGFSQVVSDEREGMESKVIRMLRGGLSAHILNYRLEWEGKPSPEEVNLRSLSPVTSRINLFDSHANTDSPVSFSDSPHFTIRTVIQAPHKIQPLFPFSRSTAYALISSDAHLPSHVFLRGTTPEGVELEVKIAVQRVPAIQGETIHRLAARKILQELKDGTSYVHGAVDKERQPALLAKWVEKEGVRVGLKYWVASHWTSFVAVERKEVEVVKEEMVVVEDDEEEVRDQRVSPPSVLDDEDCVMEDERVSNDDNNYGIHRGGPPVSPFGPRVMESGGASFPSMMMFVNPPPFPNLTSPGSNLSDIRQKGRSATPMSGYSPSLVSDDGTFYSYQESVPARSLNLSMDNNPIGKGTENERESVNKPAKRTLWSTLKRSMPLRIDRSSSQQSNGLGSDDYCAMPSNHFSRSPLRSARRIHVPDELTFPLEQSTPVVSLNLSRALPRTPPPASTPTAFSTPSESVRSMGTHGQRFEAFSSVSASSLCTSFNAAPRSDQAGIISEVFTEFLDLAVCHGVEEGVEFSAAVSPHPISTSISEQSPSKNCELPKEAVASRFPGSHMYGSSNSIGMFYSSSNAPPPERFVADTGAQPMSSRTKTLVDLQTFEGCFVLDSALAALLRVSLSDLEAKLTSSVPATPGLGLEYRKTVWATILAIELFETQLAGERSVWQLVVDKARAWIAGVGVEDIAPLERMAGEVLGA